MNDFSFKAQLPVQLPGVLQAACLDCWQELARWQFLHWAHLSPQVQSWGRLVARPSGAATGGVVGGLIGLGIPEIEAKRYEEKLKKVNYLVAVHTNESEDVDRAKHIFESAGAEDISTVSEAAVPKA